MSGILSGTKCSVLFAVALMCEAQPLIKRLNLLHQVSVHGFRLYYSAEQQTALLVTGCGRNAMAAGLMWARSYFVGINVFINVGSAGHGSFSLGECVLINKLSEHSSGKTYYPPILSKWGQKFSMLQTVDKPSDNYHQSLAYDMEASAFLSTARRLVNAEQAQVIKVISDNPANDYRQLNAAKLTELIDANCATIIEFSRQQTELLTESDIAVDEAMLEKMHAHWHITVSQHQQLLTLLSSKAVLQQFALTQEPEWQSFSKVKHYMAELQAWLLDCAPRLSVPSKSKVRS